MEVTINIESPTAEPLPQNEQQPKPLGGFNALNWYQIFALDSAVVEVQEKFSSRGSLLTIVMYHHGETLIKLTHYDEAKKMAHDSDNQR